MRPPWRSCRGDIVCPPRRDSHRGFAPDAPTDLRRSRVQGAAKPVGADGVALRFVRHINAGEPPPRQLHAVDLRPRGLYGRTERFELLLERPHAAIHPLDVPLPATDRTITRALAYLDATRMR